MVLDIPDAEATGGFRLAHVFPRDQALGTVALIIASPKEGAPASVDHLPNYLGKEERQHIVDGEVAQDSVKEDHTAARTEEFRFPPSEITIKGGN